MDMKDKWKQSSFFSRYRPHRYIMPPLPIEGDKAKQKLTLIFTLIRKKEKIDRLSSEFIHFKSLVSQLLSFFSQIMTL